MKLLLYREKRLGQRRLLRAIKVGGKQIEAKVTDLGGNVSSATLRNEGAVPHVRVGDKVITK